MESDYPPAERTVADAMLTAAKLSDTRTTVRDIRAMFGNGHVHAALVLDNGVLIAVIERVDLEGHPSDHDAAVRLGTLRGRVVAASTPLEQARQFMLSVDRRRLAVIDTDGMFQGLLCLNRTRTEFCSDRDVRARSVDGARRTAAARRPATLDRNQAQLRLLQVVGDQALRLRA